MDRVRAADVELEVEVTGSGEPVVFIHGALIADANRPLLAEPALSGLNRLITYHRRGYAGSSPVHDLVPVERQAADCLALMRCLGVERAHLVGHSYGGNIALQVALAKPAAVRTLSLLEPALFVGTSAEGYRQSLLAARDRYREAGGAVIADEFLAARWPGYHQPLDAVLPGALDQAARDAGTFFERELPGLLDWTFGEVQASRVRQPTLSFLGGGNDAPGSRFTETHQHLLAWLPDAQGQILAGATHLLQVQDPAGVAAVLAAFWAGAALPSESRDDHRHSRPLHDGAEGAGGVARTPARRPRRTRGGPTGRGA